MDATFALELKGISKHFGNVAANKNINLTLKKGEILSILGENGSGKTTLMNMISGIYYPDEGQVLVNGEEAVIKSPEDAFKYKIGMIHQHFKLVDVFTAAQNIVLGLNDEKFKLKDISAKSYSIAVKYGFTLDPDKKVYNMSVSEKQTVEIIKVLYRGADILILDEPTAVLTPQEIEKLFAVLKKMKADGKSIIIITHKLNEVMRISDRITVLRKGEYVGSVETSTTNEQQLTEMMVGKKVELKIDRVETEVQKPLLEIRNLKVDSDTGIRAIDDVSFYIRGGEILGVAGIAGCGQKELCEAIAGLRPLSGAIIHKGESIVGLHPKEIIKKGISMSFIPEDRLGMG
ncbi:MAG: ATP-binding cassette domain-containing protein, partial [Candidatus Borkfalkiaceae bacterium]|nr:ATP-binding cassette domain-containing protein [Christensenellaceae bacterium]